jgi:hypothetical protein
LTKHPDISFKDGAKITEVWFPDEEWWFGNCNGEEGFFPANYVRLDLPWRNSPVVITPPGKANASQAASVPATKPGRSEAKVEGTRAVALFDYEKMESNEVNLRDGEVVTNIDMINEGWWLGINSQGESGLFPSNYVKVLSS